MFQFVREFSRPLAVLFLVFSLAGRAQASRSSFWTTGYYPGYEQIGGLPASEIDFSALTHIIHFAVVPNPDGSLNGTVNNISEANSTNLVALAHAAGVKALISVGGGDTEGSFQSATSSSNLPVFVKNLANFVAARGYDGVDVDWEPCPSSDFPRYTNFLATLRLALNQLDRPELLTVAAAAYPPYGDSATAEYAMFAMMQSQLDQINIMTYDMSGPYNGWVTWFNSPLYDGGYRLPSSGTLMPSVDGCVCRFVTNGVAPGKLAIAAAFYGSVWAGGSTSSATGVTQPRQAWVNAPTVTAWRYTDIMASYYSTNASQWDTNAGAAYLAIIKESATNNAFISYDDPRTCQKKVEYARRKGLGGVAIWELGQDHGTNPPDPLLEAIKQAVATSGASISQHGGAEINPDSVISPSLGLPSQDDGSPTNQAANISPVRKSP